MKKLIAVFVASILVFGSAASIAADATPKKKEELTKEERADMRTRAEKLTAARAQGLPEQHVAVETAPKAKKHHTGKSKKKAPAAPKKSEPRA